MSKKINELSYINYQSETFKSRFKLGKLQPTEGAGRPQSFRGLFPNSKAAWYSKSGNRLGLGI